MAGINKVILVGNLGKDPEVRHLEGGASVASFSLATSEVFKDKSGNRKEQTEWHNIVVWRGLADIAEKYLRKGMTIYLEGKIRSRSYDKDGAKHYITEIVADSFTMLGKKENNQSNPIDDIGDASDSNINGSDGLPF
ncbi:MAG: single-stranded DNA-binding protein [Bacteroidota bacterium]